MLLALRPLNTQYNARALWVHLDDGSGEPLCRGRKKGWSLIPELVAADYPHVCEPCSLIAETATQRQEDKAAHTEMILSGL